MDHPFRFPTPPAPTGRRVRLARQAWLRSTPSGFAVGGYDQWALIGVGLTLLVVAGFGWLPLLFEAPRSALKMAAWVPVGWAFFRLTLTFELRCADGLFVLSRRFLGIPWWRRKMPVKDVDIEVDGNGDYGEDGGWPASENCFLRFRPAPEHGTRHVDVQLGPAWAAHEIKHAIERERERLHPPGCATRRAVVLSAEGSGGNTMPINKADLLGKPDENQSIEEAVMAVLDASPESAFTLDEVTDALRQSGRFSSDRNALVDVARTLSITGALSTLAAMGRVAKRTVDGHHYYYRP